MLTGVVRAVLDAPGLAALVPLVIGRAEAGDYGPRVALAASLAESTEDAMPAGS